MRFRAVGFTRLQKGDWWIALGLAVYAGGIAVWLLVREVPLTAEDGFYYFRIAQHLALGAGSTFDGVNPTNGYHPLWLLCLVPLFWLVSDPSGALELGLLVQAALLAGNTALVYRIARLQTGPLAASLSALCWTAFTYRISLQGLEFGLHALGLLAGSYAYASWFGGKGTKRTFSVLGLALAATFLARLDTLLLAGLVVWTVAQRRPKGAEQRLTGRDLLTLIGPLALACLGYGAVNFFLFGHIAPVSGAVKRVWSIYQLQQDPIFVEFGWLAAKGVHLLWPGLYFKPPFSTPLILSFAGPIGLWLWGRWAGREGWGARFLQLWRPHILFGYSSLIAYVLLFHGGLSFPPWYYAVQPLLAALLTGALAQQGMGLGRQLGKKWLFLVLVIGLWGGVPGYTLWKARAWIVRWEEGHIQRPLNDGGIWARDHLPPDAVIGAWNAGALSYLSQRRVVNLDGLVNSWAYYRSERFDLCAYWRRMGVEYLVDVFDYGGGPVQALAAQPTYPYYSRCADCLELTWSDKGRYSASWRLEVYRIQCPTKGGL